MSDEILRALVNEIRDLKRRMGALEGSEYVATAGSLLSGAATDGQVLTADGAGRSAWEDQLTTTGIAARASTAAGQTVVNNDFTIINYDSVEYDVGSCITTGAAWTYTIGVAGVYRVSAAIAIVTDGAFADGETVGLWLYLNGASKAVLDYVRNIPSGAIRAFVCGSTEVDCDVDDDLDIRALQASGANRSLYNDATFNWIAISRIA